MARRKRAASVAAEAPTPKKRSKASAREDVSESGDMRTYLARFSGGEKTFGGSQTKHDPDGMLMRRLRAVAAGKGDESAACLDVYTFLCAYEVTRNFKGLKKDEISTAMILKPVVEHLRCRWQVLQELMFDDDADTVVDEVARLEAVCKHHFRSANRCAASKLLCMLGLRVPIYDSLGRSALFGGTGERSYAEFHAKWTANYAPRRAAYQAAAKAQLAELAAGDIEAPACRLHLEWFCARAYDQRLMRDGKAVAKA